MLPLLLVSALYATHSQAINRPNIVFILVDDLGYADLSINNGLYPTPNMDELFANSLRLNRHYVHLLCSPSRTQFLTGRYAMNFAFGEFIPWDDAEIGGIPLGQPTLTNWLQSIGDYTTYGVGKWHLGYSNKQLTPTDGKGFDHFYGFYQGAIDYITKEYEDIVDGNIGIYDFWEDGKPVYNIENNKQNSMELYSNKIIQYLKTESLKTDNNPFFLYAALQSMHSPYPDIPQHLEKCTEYVQNTEYSIPKYMSELIKDYNYGKSAIEYCTLLLLTDDIIGNIINTIKDLNLYDNSLIIFTTDNGGEIVDGASNYPLRGTKGEMFEGNQRVITALSGGVIEKYGIIGQERNHIISNLDWTPTILEFAGYLDMINMNDYTWDGVSQFDMILYNKKIRDHLILNIGDYDLNSASILFEDENNNNILYKYIVSNADCIADRWVYSPLKRVIDSWSVYDKKTGKGGFILENNKREPLSQMVNNEYLFDLTNDEREFYNLLNHKFEYFDKDLNSNIINECKNILKKYVNENELFSVPLKMLHDKLDLGEPSQIEDGKFVRPFLNDENYKEIIKNMFDDDYKNGNYHSQKQVDLYLNEWIFPIKYKEMSLSFSNGNVANVTSNVEIVMVVLIVLVIAFIFIWYIYKNKTIYDDYEAIE